MKYLFTAVLCIAFCTAIRAQKVTTTINYSKHPYWIEMMDDTLTNYFEALKAYETFWKNRIEPKEEKDIIGMRGADEKEQKEKQSWLSKLFTGDKEKEGQKYAFECKKFEYWKIKTEPWVQPDGSILFPAERLKLYEKARQ